MRLSMLMLAGLIVGVMVLGLLWDLAGQPSPSRWLRRTRRRRRSRWL